MSGKGSAPRPYSVKDDVFSENYCNTFGHKFRAQKCINCGKADDVRAVQEATGKIETADAEVRSGFDRRSA